jgi:hypothetical protein
MLRYGVILVLGGCGRGMAIFVEAKTNLGLKVTTVTTAHLQAKPSEMHQNK